MDWVWKLFSKYILSDLRQRGVIAPTDKQVEEAFLSTLADSSVTILVQEPFQNSVRFKGLARASVLAMMPLLHDPMGYLHVHYGGGKFKLNFHHGWHFVATRNFKPEGAPLWVELPEVPY